jgi:CheY-like chemotaxis protein
MSLAKEIFSITSQANLPMIILTSIGIKEAKKDEAEFASYLTKPIKPAQLYKVLRKALGKTTKGNIKLPTLLSDTNLADKPPLKILLADDNEVNQYVALAILKKMGYKADVANNGLEVLGMVDKTKYDLILMDVQMPEMDGLDATRQICNNLPKPQRPKIVAMTANAIQGDREKCLEVGMDDYISKPIKIEELKRLLEEFQNK